MTTLIERVDEFGRPAWIALMVVSFVLCWPIGLIILGFLIGSGRMSCWSHGNSWQTDRWQRRMDKMQRGADRLQDGIRRMQEAAQRWGANPQPQPVYQQGPQQGPSSGNRAFDEYRTETLRRLEDEQREFLEFLERLRHAKDKSEFDQFMAERRGQTPPPAPQQ